MQPLMNPAGNYPVPNRQPMTHLFLDVTRICTRIFQSTPTGIDRVEFAYLIEALRGIEGVKTFGIITAPIFVGALRNARVEKTVGQLERVWGRHRPPLLDLVYKKLKERLESPVGEGAPQVTRLLGPSLASIWRREMIFPVRDIVRSGRRLTRQLSRSAGTPAVYFHASHSQLDKPARFNWLKNYNIPSVFLLHDVIPIDYPEFFLPGARNRHIGRLKTVSELASLVVANSQFTARAVTRHLTERKWRVPPIGVAPLGVDRWFLDASKLAPPRGGHPYAVFIGTIEPRKNLGFLLNIWRRLVEKHGRRTPRLVIIGRRGWENENILDLLERSSQLAPHVTEVSDMSDSGVASTIAGAQCLLAPSFVEGFSLPVAEGLAVGVPVLASNIEVHREISQDCATLLDPMDGPGWLAALEAIFDRDGPARAAAVERASRYRPTTWSQHVATTMDMVVEFALPKR